MIRTLPSSYSAVFIMKKDCGGTGKVCTDLWRFKSIKSGKGYLAEVEQYERHVYAIKFYLKSQAHLDDRYSFKTNDFEPRRIVLTCIQIMHHYAMNDKQSSFVFVGSSSENESEFCNKRFRFYRRMMMSYFGFNTFMHFYDESVSGYLLARNTEVANGSISPEYIADFFRNLYDF